jgi:hypothetical protein
MLAGDSTVPYFSTLALSALLMSGCAGVTAAHPPAPAVDSTSTRIPFVPASASRAIILPQWSDDTSLPTLFVSTDTGGVITMWRRDVRRPVGQIKATAPTGIAFDRSGNLFVSQDGIEGWIFVYPPPYKKPAKPKIYTKHIPYFPTQLGVGPDGTLYAADIDGNIYAFANGSKVPTLTIPLPTDGHGPSSGQGFAFDSQGNAFISYQSYFNDANDVLKCPPQSTSCMRMNLQFVNKPNQSSIGNIAFDAKGNLVLAEADDPYVVVYKPEPSSPTGYSSSPSRQIYLNGSIWPSELVFNVAKTRLYVGDDGAENVFQLSWPAGKIVKTFFVNSPVYSIALWPGAPQ